MSDPATKSQKTKQPKKPNGKRLLGFIVLTCIMVILFLSSIFYAFYASTQTKMQWSTSQSEMSQLKKQLSATKMQLAHMQKQNTQLEQEWRQKLNIMDRSLQLVLQQRLNQSEDWVIFKARYYLELAEINLTWSNNLATTLALYQEADNLLASVKDQRLFAIRQALQEDMVRLKATQSLDVNDLLNQLHHAFKALYDLPKLPTLQAPKIIEPSQSSWQHYFKQSLAYLNQLVIIRHQSKPPLTVSELTLFRENVQLLLQQAQWAILQMDNTLYQLSLSQAIDQLQQAYKNNEQSMQLIDQLTKLKSIELQQVKPDISQAITLLNQYLQTKANSLEASKMEGAKQ